MVRICLLFALITIIMSSCGTARPVATTNSTALPQTRDTPTNNNEQAPITKTIQMVNTPTIQQPTATTNKELVATMIAMNMEQKICVGAQIGKERVPQIVQSGALPNATEVTIITRCATTSMPLINGMYTPTPGNNAINTP